MPYEQDDNIEISRSVEPPEGTPLVEVEPPTYIVPEEARAEPEGEEVEDLTDLTKVSKEDVLGKRDGNSEPDDMSDITGLEEDDIEDLFEVSEEDIMGELPPEKPKPVVRFRRTNRRYIPPPPTGVRGIQ